MLIKTRAGQAIADERFERLVLRYRDEPSPCMRVEWALLRLLDERGCASLRVDLAEMAQPWEVFAAVPDLAPSVPDEPGLYMFVWRPPFGFNVADGRKPGSLSQILYIGQAGGSPQGNGNTLRSRYKDYANFLKSPPDNVWAEGNERSRTGVLSRYLALRPLEYWFATVEDRSNICLLESRLIKLLNPPANLNRGPRLRAQRPEPAFSSDR